MQVCPTLRFAVTFFGSTDRGVFRVLYVVGMANLSHIMFCVLKKFCGFTGFGIFHRLKLLAYFPVEFLIEGP